MTRLLIGFMFVSAMCDVEAQQYPTRPIRMVVAQSAGSSLDTIVRIATPKIGEVLGQQVVVDNRGGAGGTMGVEVAARAAPDGYTLLGAASSAMIVARFTYKNLPYDSLRDFEPVSNLANADAILVTHPALAAKTVKDLVALAKAQPGKLNMTSAGVGSSSHLASTLFATMTGINAVHVPYKGGGPSVAALVAGEGNFSVTPAAAVVGHVKNGRLRALALSSKTRSPALPDVPTLDEAGVPGYEYVSWNGVFVPARTPRRIINALHAAIQKALAAPDAQNAYIAQGAQAAPSASPQEFAEFVRADFERNAKLVKLAGVKPE